MRWGGGAGGVRSSWIDRLAADPAYRRRVLLWAAGITIGGITATSAVLTIAAFMFAPDLADGIGFAGVALTGATFLLAVVAAAVAVLAYAASTGVPELSISMRFPFSEINNPVFQAERLDDGNLKAVSFKQLTGEILLRNDSEYPARNPVVVVRLHGMAVLGGNISEGWAVTQFANTVGVTAVQWDGGPEHPIHGNSTRQLPELDLDGLRTFSGPAPRLEVEILADAYRKTVTIPAGFKVNGRVMVFPAGELGSPPMWL